MHKALQLPMVSFKKKKSISFNIFKFWLLLKKNLFKNGKKDD